MTNRSPGMSERGGQTSASIMPLEDKLESPRFIRAMATIGCTPDDLRPHDPPEVPDPSTMSSTGGLEQAALGVRWELREKRRQRDLAKVVDARRQMCLHDEGGSPSAYVPGRFRTVQPSAVVLGLSRSLPAYDHFRKESRHRGQWAKGMHQNNIAHKKEMINRAASTDVNWQQSQKEFREHENMLATRLQTFRKKEATKQLERVKEGERKLTESTKRLAKVAGDWEIEGQRRVDAFDAKCEQSEQRVADEKTKLFGKSCDRDDKIIECLARRKAHLDEFVGKTYGKYLEMEAHLQESADKKEALFQASLKEAGNQAELAANEREALRQRNEAKAMEIAEHVGTRFENLEEWEKKRDLGFKNWRKGRELEWNKSYGNVKKNVKELGKSFEEKRKSVYERQERVFAQGEAGLAKKKLFAGTRKEIENAYRDSVVANQERQLAAEEYKRKMCCEFWATRSNQFDDVARFRNKARSEFEMTKKRDIHIQNELREVVGDIKSVGYRDVRHDKVLKQHGLPAVRYVKPVVKEEEAAAQPPPL